MEISAPVSYKAVSYKKKWVYDLVYNIWEYYTKMYIFVINDNITFKKWHKPYREKRYYFYFVSNQHPVWGRRVFVAREIL